MAESDKQQANSVEYAGFWRRAVAYTLDGLIFIPVTIAIYFACLYSVDQFIGDGSWDVRSLLYVNEINEVNVYGSLVSSLVVACFMTAIYGWFYSYSKWQATPGKRIMSAYVVGKKKHEKVSVKQGFFRTAIIALLGLIMALTQFGFDVTMLDSEGNQNKANELASVYLSELSEELEEQGLEFTEMYKWDDELFDKYKQEYDSLEADIQYEFSEMLSDLQNESHLSKQNKWKGLVIIILSFVMLVWYSFAAFTKQKTALHDIIAGTRVLKGKI